MTTNQTTLTPERGVPPDWLVALLVAGAVFAIYVATMYPGLHDVGDAAKFSFVGKVLGTPHAPGYPLYILASHLFSYVPWGTLAHRMNGLSAIVGALAVMLVYFAARRAGTGKLAAASAALACGLGHAFWSRSLYAKGYTLNAALVAGGFLALLRWDDSRKTRDLYLAITVFALSAGNHLTVIALLPALVIFCLLTDARAMLRPRTLLVGAVIVLLGFSQYSLIIVRTLQQAPYLEAKATNLQELWAVMTARRFAHEIGAFSWTALFSTRVPLVARLVARELGPIGLALTLTGFLWLALRRWRVALLLGLGALGVAALTANMGSNEDEGFLLSVFVLLGTVAATGLEQLLSLVRRAPRAVAAILVAAVAVAPPAYQAATNFASHDHHAETAEIVYFDALFAALPQKTAIVAEEYRVDMMVLYKLLGERAAGPRDIQPVQAEAAAALRSHDAGYDVVAFEEGRRKLAASGFRFVPFEPFLTPANEGLFRRRALYRLASVGNCVNIGNLGWIDVSKSASQGGRLTVKIDDFHPFESDVTIWAAGNEPFAPALVGGGGAGTPVLVSDVFRRGDAAAERRMTALLASDHAVLPAAAGGTRYVTRADVRVNDKGAWAIYSIDLGGTPAVALARGLVDRDNANRASVCSHELGTADVWPAASTRAAIAPDAVNAVFGSGWYPVERRPDGSTYRWTAATAELVVPIGAPRAATVTLTAEPFVQAGRPDCAVTLVVNGHRAGSRPLQPSPTSVAWDVPAGFWRSGLNALVFEVAGAGRPSAAGNSKDDRLLGIAVGTIDLAASGPKGK